MCGPPDVVRKSEIQESAKKIGLQKSAKRLVGCVVSNTNTIIRHNFCYQKFIRSSNYRYIDKPKTDFLFVDDITPTENTPTTTTGTILSLRSRGHFYEIVYMTMFGKYLDQNLICSIYLLEGSLFWVEDGCPRAGIQVEGSFKPKDFQTCVRCCSSDGMTCSTPLSLSLIHI